MKTPHMRWSRKHRRWVDRDDRTPEQKARHEKIAKDLDQDQKRVQEKLRKEAEKVIVFCPRCFASSDGGSWGDGCDEGHCFNCGASNSTVRLPRWAIESIRQQASWVGKRYYAHEEDHVIAAELLALRKLVRKFPGRTVERHPTGWWVKQEMPDGTQQMICVDRKRAKTAPRAFGQARLLLHYVPEEALPKKGKAKK